jgi:integrase
LDKRSTGVGSEVVVHQESIEERLFVFPNWGTIENIIARILHGLKAAKIEVSTPDGVLDFHALRTTYITNLVRAGLYPKTVQTLARHSTVELTMKIYARLNKNEIDGSTVAVKPVSASVPGSTSSVRHKRTRTG